MTTRRLYRWLSLLGTFKAAIRGPGPLARRQVRRYANKEYNRELRRLVKY